MSRPAHWAAASSICRSVSSAQAISAHGAPQGCAAYPETMAEQTAVIRPMRVTASVATWCLAAMLFSTIPLRWAQNIQSSLTGSGSPLTGTGGTDAPLMRAFIVFTLSLVLLSRWSIAGDGFGGRWAHKADPIARFVRATVWVVAILWVTSLVRIVIESLTGTARAGPSSFWETYSAADRAFAGLFAGAFEETLDIAVPAGLAFAFATAVSRWSTGRGRTALSAQTLWTVAVAAAGIGLVTRYTDHLYQGGLSSAFAVLWGAGLLVVFAVYRSVLPLILGHFIFDAFVAGNPLLPNDWLPYLALMAACLGGIFAASYAQLSRRH
jgi:hypothetical protein